MGDKLNWSVHDHQKYDVMLDECELAASMGDWNNAVKLFYAFVDEMKLHMRIEDEVLYPMFIEETGDPAGDIKLLTHQHDEIARLLHDLAYVIRNNDFDHFEESLEPLHRILNEHNQHEEAVFTNMGNTELLARRDEIMQRLHTIQSTEGRRIWDF